MKDRRTGKVACYFVRGLSVSTMTSGDQHVLCGEVNNVVLKQSRQGLICFKAEFCPADVLITLKKTSPIALILTHERSCTISVEDPYLFLQPLSKASPTFVYLPIKLPLIFLHSFHKLRLSFLHPYF